MDQHHAFEAGVEEFKKYAYSVTPEDFDARRLIELVDKFQAVLIKHLEEEIPTLLELDRYGAHHVARAMGELDAVVLELIDDKVCLAGFRNGSIGPSDCTDTMTIEPSDSFRPDRA